MLNAWEDGPWAVCVAHAKSCRCWPRMLRRAPVPCNAAVSPPWKQFIKQVAYTLPLLCSCLLLGF